MAAGSFAQTWQIGSPNAGDVIATLNGGTLTITGTGAMMDWDFLSMGPWYGDGYNSDITKVEIGSGVTTIGDDAFYICNNLTSVTIPSSVTSIGYEAFCECWGLTSITIPNSVTTIGERAFFDSGLTSVTIPNSVTSIGDDAFKNCYYLTSVSIGNGVTTIGQSAFNGCLRITSVTIGSSVTTIGQSAFGGCRSLTSVTIPNSVTTIGDSAFGGCTGLTSVTIPTGVTSIGNGVFYNCSSLTSVTIGSSVTTIWDQAFSYCTDLTSISCCALEPPTVVNAYVFYTINKSTCVLYVPVGSKVKYQAADVWKDFLNIVEDPSISISTEPGALVAALSLYPNPISDYLYINGIEAETPITIADISGKIVLQTIASSNEAVSVAHLPKGVYIVQVAGKVVKIVVND